METQNKIKELTEKIHREGVEKANREAEEIIDKAGKEAEEIIKNAKNEADSIVSSARKQADELSQKIKADIRLSSQQAISNLKREISELVQASVIKEPLDEVFKDDSFITGLLEIIVKNWEPCGDEADLNVLLPKDKIKMAETYFRQRSAQALNSGFKLKEYNGPGNGFEIRPENGRYKINMTDEAFYSFLKDYFKAQTLEFLYGGE